MLGYLPIFLVQRLRGSGYERSLAQRFGRYHRVRFLTSRMLRDVSIFAMQSEEDARRIIALGALPERVVVTGNLKTDLAPAEAGGEAVWQRLLGLGDGDLVWIAGSTHR